MKYIILILLMVFMTACRAFEVSEYKTDSVLERELFFECMRALPTGPKQTKYNDWDEVVIECRRTAHQFSTECVKYCN